MASDVDICSGGLLLVGADVITSFTGDTRESKVSAGLYPRTRNSLLASYPWRFAHNQVVLARLVAVPEFTTEWAYAYQLPSDYGRITKIEGGTDFRILNDKLLSNQSSVKIEYSFVPPEVDFPDWFSRLLEIKMARLFAIAIADDESKESKIERLERSELVTARAIDNQSTVNSQFDSSILIDVRG